MTGNTYPMRYDGAKIGGVIAKAVRAVLEPAIERGLPEIARDRDAPLKLMVVPDRELSPRRARSSIATDFSFIQFAEQSLAETLALHRAERNAERRLQFKAWWFDDIQTLASIAGLTVQEATA